MTNNKILKNHDGNNVQIITEGVKKSYWVGDLEVKALKGTDLKIEEGDFKFILGPSGSGKTTLLNVLSGIDSPDEGKIFVNFGEQYEDISKFSKEELAVYRRQKLGIIFQFYNLIPILTAIENVELAARFSNIENARKKSYEMLDKLGLDNKKADRYPNQLSGGEQQRVAIARALIKDPAFILADEPTGNLDSEKSDEIYNLLKDLAEEFNTTVLIVTHDEYIADKYAKSKLYIRDGIIIEDKKVLKKKYQE